MLMRSMLLVLFVSLLIPPVHSAQPEIKIPNLQKALWQRPLFLDKDLDEDNEKAAKAVVDRAMEASRGEPLVPGFSPLIAGKWLVYSTYSDFRAVFLIEEKGINSAGDIYFKSTPMDGSLATILSHKDLRVTMETWLNRTFANQRKSTNLLYENTLLGRLTTSHRLVYTVDDLSVPAPQAVFPWMWSQGQLPGKVKEYVLGNSLQAFELATGKFRWRLGSDPENYRHPLDDFTNSHFLGSPVSVGDRLYALNEKNQGDKDKEGKYSAKGDAELRLVCIDPKKMVDSIRPQVVLPVLSLGKVPENLRITHNPVRRISSVELVHHDGILICPTNAGKIIGVDIQKMAVRWTHTYKKEEKKKPAKDEIEVFDGRRAIEFHREWRMPGAFLHKDRLVFAAPDEGSVHCIRVKDGKPVWQAPRKDGLYVAGVFGDKIVVVGPKTCWALGVDDGKEKWALETGVPSGRGTALGNIYYLPIRRGIMLIDIAKGKILQTVDAAAGDLPGNLLIHQDMLISQSATHIAAYPLKATKK
ncbi:MAG TPA: PQQ-binding-like beta-propeller repeat protein [Gemmataceae bacterium]|nr:PQQ-binding-like beta-propeller repeat protein [Gemmataceae bacterium]